MRGSLLTLLAFDALSSLVVGCRTGTLQSSLPEPLSSNAPGIRYFAPRDLLVINAAATFNYSKGWDTTSAAEPCDTDAKSKSRWKETVMTVTNITVPDRSVIYRLARSNSGSSAQTLRVNTTPDGLLQGINYQLHDQRAEIVTNVVKTVAGIAGSVVGLDVALPRDRNSFKIANSVKIFDAASKPAQVNALMKLARSRAEKCAFSQDTVAIGKLFQSREKLEAAVETAIDQRDATLAKATLMESVYGVRAANGRDSLQMRLIASLESRLSSVREAIAASTATVNKKTRASLVDTVVNFRAVVGPEDLPAAANLAADLTMKSAIAQARKTELKALIDSTHMLVALGELGDTTGGTATAGAKTTADKCRPQMPGDCVDVYHRMPIPRLLKFYKATQNGPDAPLRWYETQVVSLIGANDPIISATVSIKTLGDNSSALTFSRAGTVTGFEQTTSAGLATATSALASALTGARQEFQAGLAAVQTAGTTVNTIEADQRARRLKDLQDQKALLDAKLVLDGATATKATLLQKQELDAQIQLLATQQSLASAQQAAGVNDEVSSLKTEMAKLQAQIELLKVQIDLEKQKAALKALQAPSQ